MNYTSPHRVQFSVTMTVISLTFALSQDVRIPVDAIVRFSTLVLRPKRVNWFCVNNTYTTYGEVVLCASIQILRYTSFIKPCINLEASFSLSKFFLYIQTKTN